MLTENHRITDLLARLIQISLPINEHGAEFVESIYDEFLRQMDLIGSTSQSRIVEKSLGLNMIISQFETKLIPRSSKDEFQQCIEQLLHFSSPSDIARYLSLLLQIIERATLASRSSFINTSGTNFNRKLSRVASLQHEEGHSFINDNRSILSGLHGGYQESFENLNFDRMSDRRSVYSTSRIEDTNRNYTFEELLIPYFEHHISDKVILEKIVYTLVGTTSDIFPLNQDEILIPREISNGLSGQLHDLLEVSLLYMKLTITIQNFETNRLNSQVKNAFFSFINEELNEYVRLVNGFTTEELSLKSAFANLWDELVKLRFLNFITKESTKLTGDELLSFLYKYHNHGDIIIRTTARDLLNYCLIPFVDSLHGWIVDGELSEKNEDFFIASTISPHNDASYNHSYQNIKQDNFKIQHKQIPGFFCTSLADGIYNIGITNVFLKFQCRETQWVNEFAQKSEFLIKRLFHDNAKLVQTLKSLEFSELIKKLHAEITNYFTYIIHKKFHFMETLNALADFLLMRKGDFIHAIIRNGKEILDEPSNSLTSNDLSNLLRESIEKTSARTYANRQDNYVLNHLDARVLHLTGGDIGWEVFTLDFRMDPPLSSILNNESNGHKREYLRIFNHLWKIKRLNNLFNDEWLVGRKLRNKGRDKRFTRLKLFQRSIHNFIKYIESYLFNDIIDINCQALIKKLSAESSKLQIQIKILGKGTKIPASMLKPDLSYLNGTQNDGFTVLDHGVSEYNLNELSELHQNFLYSITKHKLFDKNDEQNRGPISRTFYITQLSLLINAAYKFTMLIREFNQVVSLDDRNSIDAEEDQGYLSNIATVYNNLQKVFDEFNYALNVFVNDLRNDDDQELRYLGIALVGK